MMNIKTLYLFPVCLFAGIVVLSQTNKQYAKIKVSYVVNTTIDKNQKSYKLLSEVMPELVKKRELIASEFDFSLVFNDSISIFYLEDKLYSDNNAASFAIIDAGYFGRIKQQTNNYITENLQEDFGKFLVSRPHQKWELHDDTKMIGEYLCFKATTFYTTTNPQGKTYKHDFVAWYAPQLPYKFGPLGYGNLSGLIIELQGKKFSYGIEKIQFFNDDERKKNRMPKLKKMEIITGEKLEELAAKNEEQRRGQ